MNRRQRTGGRPAVVGLTCTLLVALGVSGGLGYGGRAIEDAVHVVVHGGAGGSGHSAASDQFAPAPLPPKQTTPEPPTRPRKSSNPSKLPPTASKPSVPPVRRPGVGGCAAYRRDGYTTRQACDAMASALQTHQAHVCGHRHWQTLYHFSSRSACKDFVARGG